MNLLPKDFVKGLEEFIPNDKFVIKYIKKTMSKTFNIINANRTLESKYTGKGVNIAIIDTGCFLHSCIRENVVSFYDYINYEKYSYDDNGHGTHIAGIIAASKNLKEDGVRGLAPDVNLFVFKALDKTGNGDMEHMIRALEEIRKINKNEKIHLLNFSVGVLPKTDLGLQNELLKTIDKMWDEGITVVTAAGNNGPNKNTITVPGV